MGKGESKRVEVNEGWNDEGFNGKDGEGYVWGMWRVMGRGLKDNDLEV